MSERPKVENAPGLVWAPRKADGGSWVAEWHARTDLIRRGFLPQRLALWKGEWPSEADCILIQDRCKQLQAEMLVWGRRDSGSRGRVRWHARLPDPPLSDRQGFIIPGAALRQPHQYRRPVQPDRAGPRPCDDSRHRRPDGQGLVSRMGRGWAHHVRAREDRAASRAIQVRRDLGRKARRPGMPAASRGHARSSV